MELIVESKVNDNIITNLNKLLDKCISDNYQNNTNATKSGFQSKNVIEFIEPIILNELYKHLDIFFEKRKPYYNFEKVFLDHIHLIEYHEKGYQDPHDHFDFEDFSFILYLNDSDGATNFYLRDSILSHTPEKGKLIVFDSFIWHSGGVSTKGKRVAVGSLTGYNKKWNPRDERFEFRKQHYGTL